MTTDEKPRIKITYATLRADNEELHAGFEAAVARVRAGLGAHHQNLVNGAWRDGDGAFEVRSPIDTDIVLGTLRDGHRQPTSTTPWPPPGPRSRPGPRRRGPSVSRSCAGPPSSSAIA